MTDLDAIYADGLHAGHRIGKYKDKGHVENPYPVDTEEHDMWEQGHKDGTKDYIDYRIGKYV